MLNVIRPKRGAIGPKTEFEGTQNTFFTVQAGKKVVSRLIASIGKVSNLVKKVWYRIPKS